MTGLPPQTHTLPVAERVARGQALRQQCARRTHGDWSAPADRRDPIEILVEQGATRLAHLLPIRYHRMKASPFAFLRGSAAVMAADLAATPASGLVVQAAGDCHCLNFGGFATPDDVEALEMVQKGLANWQDDRWSEMSRGMGREGGEQLNSDEFHLRLFWRKWNEMMGGQA